MRHLPFEKPPIRIHNARLADEQNECFEIDILLLTDCFFLLLEVKNWYGTLYVDQERQIIRVGDDGQEAGMPNPFSQVKLQSHRLKKWLNRHDFDVEIPLLNLVVIAFPSTIIKPLTSGTAIPSNLVYSNQLPFFLKKLAHNYPCPLLTIEQFAAIQQKITGEHRPQTVDILDRFNLSKDDLIWGVFCPDCHTSSMTKTYGGWTCSICSHRSKNAHLTALRDYQLLFGERITNRETRTLLKLDSADAAKNVLRKCRFDYIGENKKRVYLLDLI